MKLQFLGTGSAFTVWQNHWNEKNWQSNSVLIHEDEDGKIHRLLIDCGGDVRHAMFDQGLRYGDIEGAYISHLHGDHSQGAEFLGFCKFFDPSQRPPDLYIHQVLVSKLWQNTLSGGMESIEGDMVALADYFKVHPVKSNCVFTWCGVKFKLIQTVHIMNDAMIVPSFGLQFEINGKVIFYTGDTQFCPPQIQKFYDQSDIIIHDCETMYLPDGTPLKSKVHSHFEDLCTLDDKTRAKMWLTHYQDGKLPDAEAKGFKGFARKGQILEF